MSKFSIRRATPADASAIAEAHRDSIETLGPTFYPPATVRDWATGLTASLYLDAMKRGERFHVAIGELKGKPAVLGFSSQHGEGLWHRTAVYVRGSAARHGIGTALFRLAEADAIEAGAGQIDLDASLAAVDFYRANGFEEIGRGEHRLRSGRRMACVFMRKLLRPQAHKNE